MLKNKYILILFNLIFLYSAFSQTSFNFGVYGNQFILFNKQKNILTADESSEKNYGLSLGITTNVKFNQYLNPRLDIGFGFGYNWITEYRIANIFNIDYEKDKLTIYVSPGFWFVNPGYEGSRYILVHEGWYNWLTIDAGFQLTNWFIEIEVGKAIGNRKIETIYDSMLIKRYNTLSDKFIKLGVGYIWKVKLN